jgi:hypothetical protein
MYKPIPPKKPGDTLLASEVNSMNGGIKEIFNAKPGSYMNGLRTNSIFGDLTNPPHVEVVVEIGEAITAAETEDYPDDFVEGEDDMFWCRIRYYDIKTKTWKTHTEEHKLDPRGTDTKVETDDRIVAFFSQQRQAYIPISESPKIVECELLEDHPGKDVVFEIKVSTWDPSTDGWYYSEEETNVAHGIDRRYVPEYPGIGARGLFMRMPSSTYGILYECVSMDCPAN